MKFWILFCNYFLLYIASVNTENEFIDLLFPKGRADCSEIGAVRYVQIFEIDKNLVVVWQEPESVDVCGFNNLYYNIKYEGYKGIQAIVTQELHYTFELDSYICAPGKITITPYDMALGNGTEYTAFYNTELPSIEEVFVSQQNHTFNVSWSLPNGTQECRFTYSVNYTDKYQNITVWSNGTSASLGPMIWIPCVTGKVAVNMFLGNASGPIAYNATVMGVGPVTNYEILSLGGQFFTSFNPPTNSELCNLTYKIIETDLNCSRKSIEVYALDSNLHTSESLFAEIETEIQAVTNLRALISGEVLSVTWDPVFKASECNISYLVKYDNDYVYKKNTTNSYIDLNVTFVPCYYASIEVWPISSTNHIGLPTNITVQPPLGPIQNLELSVTNGYLTAVWERPAYSQYCALTYLLTVEENGTVHVFISGLTNYTFDFCSSINLVINPLSNDGLTGPSYSISYNGEGCSVFVNQNVSNRTYEENYI